jgi:glycosyltransferase involved in cell wall biosynthesis
VHFAVEMVRIMAKLEPGGAQLSALRLTHALESRGVRQRWLAGEASAEGLKLARSRGVDVEAFGRDGLQWEPSEQFAAWLEPRIRGVPLVHAHMFGGWWAAAQAIADDVALVASEHNALSWPGACRDEAFAQALPRVDEFFAHGAAARQHVLAHGLDPRRLNEGRSAVEGFDATPRPGLPSPRITYAGRLAPDKGPDVLIEALAALRACAPAYLLGCGALEPLLRRRVAELGIAERVRFAGWQEEPGPWIAGASVHVVPSREDAFPQSALLGLGLAVPVIGTTADGGPDVLGDGRGVLVEPEDPAALGAAIDAVLSGALLVDPRPGAEFARQFTADSVAEPYLRAYERAVAARSGRPVT